MVSGKRPGDPAPLTRRPGDVLLRDYMLPRGLSQLSLAKTTGIPRQTINRIIHGHHGITAVIAWKLAEEFETPPEFWMELQDACDLQKDRPIRSERIEPDRHRQDDSADAGPPSPPPKPPPKSPPRGGRRRDAAG